MLTKRTVFIPWDWDGKAKPILLSEETVQDDRKEKMIQQELRKHLVKVQWVSKES